MLLAASIPDNLIYLIAAAAYGVFAWWNDRRQKKAMEQEEKQRASQEQRTAQETKAGPSAKPGAPAPNSEEERMRRFLEALGLPPNQQQAPPRPTPAPPPEPKPQPRPAPKPVSPTLAPRPVAVPIPHAPLPKARPSQAPTRPQAPLQRPAPRPVIVIEEIAPESNESDQFAEASAAMRQIDADFARLHDMAPDDMAPDVVPLTPLSVSGLAPVTGVDINYVSPQARALRQLLRSPESLRGAILVSEVLGPPKGL